MAKKMLPAERKKELIEILKSRFEENMRRHEGIKWDKIQERLEKSDEKLWSIDQMEITGGEPDVIDYDKKKDRYVFCDCSSESPKGRRSLCYDPASLKSRKQHKPKNSAIGMADEMGIEILSEEQYRTLQELGEFDLKTSSWIVTPREIRKLGGALFADRRYNSVFVYHNGAESYYAARGFRATLRI